jgi:hypothetical protein
MGNFLFVLRNYYCEYAHGIRSYLHFEQVTCLGYIEHIVGVAVQSFLACNHHGSSTQHANSEQC